MKRIAAVLITLFSMAVQAGPSLSICHGEYALCAASPTTPVPGKTVTVKGTVFPMGTSVCPVLTGESIADLSLMNGSCDAPSGKDMVWSLFSTRTSYPQAPSWDNVTAVIRTFTMTDAPGGGMSNMWSFPCTKRPKKVNGAKLADCVGPMNESPWTTTTVPVGSTIGTAAPVGANNPVGGNFP